ASTPATTTLVAAVNSAITPIVFTTSGFATTPTLAISPLTLPAGLTFTPGTGTLSGTPTQAAPSAAYTVTATSGVATTATATITLSVTALALAPRSIVANVGTTITPTLGYTATEFTTAGLVGATTLAVSPALPAGLTMSATTGAITGKPTVAVTTPTEHTITATDANGATAKGIVTITVSPTQLEAPVVYYAQAGTSSGSLRVLFLGPVNAPAGQTYAAEVYDATGATLLKTVRPMTSLTDIIGLTPGTTYSVIIVAEASSGYLASRSAPKSGVASLGGTKLIPPTITSISGGPTVGSISVSFNPTPNATAGLTYTVQVYDEDQLTLIRAVPKATSPTLITGLTPGVTYFVFVAADATLTTLESLSRGRTVMATGSKVILTNAATAATVAFPNGSVGKASAGSALGAGWLRPTAAQAAKAKRVTVALRPATTPSKAPVVKVPAKRAVALRLKGLTSQALYVADVKLAGKWSSLGSARATWGGAVTLPAFTATTPGSYLMRLTAMGQSPLYLKVLVAKKGAA
ncbi:MAG: Ig domain-containing protein, partial [Actinobacteria bacterium]|nr:Ig domain-containing protein [Actinomycetota bacterium]